jgi:hypothetical protein
MSHDQSEDNPYVGAQPYSEKDGPLFFGREREVREVANLLVAMRVLLLLSPSGAGKTSLIRAKLIPLLRDKEFDVLPIIRVGHPSLEEGSGVTNRYVRSTQISLESPGSPDGPAESSTDLANLQGALERAERLGRARAGGRAQDTVLIFDQFEEILMADPTDVEAKGKFFAALGEALSGRKRWALFALREDYLASLAPYAGAIPTRLSTTYRLDLLDTQAARLAICAPAALRGVTFEEEAADKLIDDLREIRLQEWGREGARTTRKLGLYIEPVQLQVICQLLWEVRDLGSGRITPADLAKVGSVDQALGAYYDDRVRRAAGDDPARERLIRDWFTRVLITEQGVRGMVLKTYEQNWTQGLHNDLIQSLIDSYLVRAEPRRGETWFELAHDRLIEPILGSNRDWLERNLTRNQKQALLWERDGRPENRLIVRPEDLAEFERWAASRLDVLTPTERAFLDANRRFAREQERFLAESHTGSALTGGSWGSVLSDSSAADLEIGLYRWDDKHYAVDLRYSPPGAQELIRVQPSAPMSFDFEALCRLAQDPNEYGRVLWRSLFADEALRQTFNQWQADAQRQNLALRVRLYVSPNAPEMQALRWETLCDPDGARLATSEDTQFSRYLLSPNWRPIRLAQARGIDMKVLLFIAAPSDLATYRPGGRELYEVDVAGESARARQALPGVAVEERSRLAASARRATLDGLMEELKGGCDIVYLVCHGSLVGGEPVLYLEGADGRVDPVRGADLVRRLSEVAQQPSLVVLSSCQGPSGAELSSADGGALAALGPRLAEAGLAAVLAMQGNISASTLSAFLPVFFAELFHDGQIDRAAAVARGKVGDRPDWWVPVLFLRLRSGKLWGTVPAVASLPKFKWEVCLHALQMGRLIPILGVGLLKKLIGTPREIARRWAEKYRFPLAPQDRDDLPKVAQFLAVEQGRPFPRSELSLYLHKVLRQRFDEVRQMPPQAPLDDLIVTAGRAIQRLDPNEPHTLLASLPFHVYITTNGDSLLEESLRVQGKMPRVKVFQGEVLEPSPQFEVLTTARPLVYHLFGHLSDPDSLILTQDDYFDFLTNFLTVTPKASLEVPSRVLRSSLVFLGLQPEELGLQVLLHSINSTRGSIALQRLLHIAVIDPEEGYFLDPDGARRYVERRLSRSFDGIQIYWGQAEDFLRELHQRWQAQELGEGQH